MLLWANAIRYFLVVSSPEAKNVLGCLELGVEYWLRKMYIKHGQIQVLWSLAWANLWPQTWNSVLDMIPTVCPSNFGFQAWFDRNSFMEFWRDMYYPFYFSFPESVLLEGHKGVTVLATWFMAKENILSLSIPIHKRLEILMMGLPLGCVYIS